MDVARTGCCLLLAAWLQAQDANVFLWALRWKRSWKRGPGGGKPPSETSKRRTHFAALAAFQGALQRQGDHCGRGLVLTSNRKPRRGPHHLPRGTRCIYLEQPRPKPCIHDGAASLTDAHSSHSTEAVSRGLAVRADGTVSVLQGETKNDAQTKAKTTHTGDRYLRQRHPEELAKERGSAFVTSPARLSLWPWGSHRACLFSSICKISLLQ